MPLLYACQHFQPLYGGDGCLCMVSFRRPQSSSTQPHALRSTTLLCLLLEHIIKYSHGNLCSRCKMSQGSYAPPSSLFIEHRVQLYFSVGISSFTNDQLLATYLGMPFAVDFL